MKVSVGHYTFDNVSYDAGADVLYLHVVLRILRTITDSISGSRPRIVQEGSRFEPCHVELGGVRWTREQLSAGCRQLNALGDRMW